MALGKVAASGNSNVTRTYTYNDELNGSVTSHMIYYRVKIVDKNGAYKFSEVVVLRNPGTFPGGIRLYPSAFSGTGPLSLEIESDQQQKVTLRFFTSSGQLIRQEERQIMTGSHKYPVETGLLPVGINFISVSGQAFNIMMKVLRR
jgi:hypothetical protein